MPMPHRTFAQVARRRLQGKEGSERIRTINELKAELPDYRNGPYADLRKWLDGELERTRVRAKVVHRDSLQVRREGAAQVALVGAPNAGKSSLLQALSEIQIKTGDYAFTTLRPVPALTRIGGVPVQLVEIPGLIDGAHEDRGGGRALLGVLRNADAIVWCQAVTAPLAALHTVRAEVAAAGIDKPGIVAATKWDDAGDGDLERLEAVAGGLRVVPVSVLDDASLDALREAVWALTGLIRVRLRRAAVTEQEPLALHAGATVADVADAIHHELGSACAGDGDLERLEAVAGGLRVVPVSVLDDASLDALREAVWALTGLIRVRLRRGAVTEQEPLALHAGATVADVADAIHHELGSTCAGARVWGASARFDGQRVGRGHVVADLDEVEVLTR